MTFCQRGVIYPLTKPRGAFKNDLMGIIDYLRETKGELKHVAWPSQKQTIAFTIIVIIISFAVAYFLGAFDYIFTFLLERFILRN